MVLDNKSQISREASQKAKEVLQVIKIKELLLMSQHFLTLGYMCQMAVELRVHA